MPELTLAHPPTTSIVPDDRARSSARRLVAAFLAGRSPATLRAYNADLAHFAAHLGVPTAEDAAEELLSRAAGPGNEMVLSYKNAMLDREKPLAPATVNRRLAALRSLVKLARMLGIASWSIEVDSVPSEAYRDTQGPGEARVRQMLERLAERGDAKGIRDYAIVVLLHDCALRRGELCSLDLEHFDRDKGVYILAKGRRQRAWFPVPDDARDAVEDWISLRGDAPGPLFTALDGKNRGHRLTGAAIYAIVSELGVDVGVKTRPHGLRHSGISSAAALTNGNQQKTQAFARHANANTTQRYIDNKQDQQREVAQLVSRRRRSGSSAP